MSGSEYNFTPVIVHKKCILALIIPSSAFLCRNVCRTYAVLGGSLYVLYLGTWRGIRNILVKLSVLLGSLMSERALPNILR